MNAQNIFEKRDFTDSEKNKLLYNILFPEKSCDDKLYPIVLFLHGAGERGNDNEKSLTHIKELFLNAENKKNYPTFVIVPQCPEDERWVEVSWKLETHIKPEIASKSMNSTIQLLNYLIENFPIDKNRIYITGLSMGGFGTWDAICRYPDFFAAAIPICGGGDENTASQIVNIPIWAFHGDNDKAVNVSRSRNMINALRKAGGNPKYTEYKGVGHGSWINAYRETELLKWLFSNKKAN
ncbi:MAG: prolyl oligopeptidase family serine peptidase [Bacteroidales bacterium]|nr:prolyl oligopeptidase family serine peptidase [Bacteroidales bacterium]MBN2755740.1 prolyl oligopeptidase family serine peptidase [Bacteroidales bacterium]